MSGLSKDRGLEVSAVGLSQAEADKLYKRIITGDIGTPGQIGFGVGCCPPARLPDGMTGMSGYAEPGHANYGNYQYSDGSVMVYVPAFWCKIGTGSNGMNVNDIHVKPYGAYSSELLANADGYFLPLAFVDGGSVQPGFFVDKYKCSKQASGSGFIASSIPAALPISTSSAHNPISDLTACSANVYYEAINAAHARDGQAGAINSDSIFFCNARAMWAALALLSMAHAQAATSTAACAWYDSAGLKNYPKGCNNNALGDTDDAKIAYDSDGYDKCGKTGSGRPFAKTTHNGQHCGVADLNGLMFEINIGVTCIASSVSISSATKAYPCKITAVGHGCASGDYVMITGITGMTQINDKIFTISAIDEDNFTLDGVDSTAFAAYKAGGTVTSGKFYRKKDSVCYRDITAGNSESTDHWGAVGVAAMMDEFDMVFKTDYPNNGFSQRMGSGANQVLSAAVDGNAAVLTSLGMPQDADGIAASGSNLFGSDAFYQYICNELCLRSGGYWTHYAYAGVWYSSWGHTRSRSDASVGFRCACYPV